MSIGVRVFLSFGTALVVEHANENTICSPQYGFEGTLFLLMAWRAPGRLRKSGSLLMSGTMQGGADWKIWPQIPSESPSLPVVHLSRSAPVGGPDLQPLFVRVKKHQGCPSHAQGVVDDLQDARQINVAVFTACCPGCTCL